MIQQIGYVDAVIARPTDAGLVLVDGHLRADMDPEAEIPVLVVDLDESEAGQVLASLDPLASMARADSAALKSLVDSLPPLPDTLALPPLPVLPVENEDDPAPPAADPTSRAGDVYQLGRHRLMCGDCYDAEAVARLLDGAKPSLMVTDPPYGVNYEPGWRNDIPTQFAPSRTGKVTHDDRIDWGQALEAYAPEVAYVWSPSGNLSLEFARILLDARFEIRNQLIWRKHQLVFSRGHYHRQHEVCWYAVRRGKTARWCGDRKQTTIWDIANLNPVGTDGSELKTDHSTQKPIECMERPIRNHRGDVYDPFVGSGTTILAAERQNRTCYAMEVAPGYVDATLSRWEAITGEKPTQLDR